MMHVDDWLDAPAKDEAERIAKDYLEHCRRPAIQQDYGWLARNALLCTYRGERYRCTGASRMGDVWLARDPRRTRGYDLRVDVAECGQWELMAAPHQEATA